MDPLSWLYIVLIILLIALSGFFSSTETAYACLNQFKIRVKADEGDKTAKLILKTYDRFDRTLIMSLLGYNACSVISSSLATILFLGLMKGITSDTTISLISTIIMALLMFIFADMVPKMVAKKAPEAVARNNVYIALFFYYLFFPLIFIFNALSKLVKKMFKTKTDLAFSEEDFVNVVDDIEEKGLIEENESDIIYASLEFADTTVKEILTKIDKVFYIDLEGLTKDKLNSLIKSCSFNRIPVCYKNRNNIIGILHVQQYIQAVLKNPSVSISSLLQKPYFVDTKVKLDDMLDGFKKHHTHIAIVKSGNNVIGIITMEDVLEELVGKIAEPSERKKQ